MEVIDPREFISEGMFREVFFRDAVKKVDWTQYQGKPVIIEGCSSITIPTWAFLVLTAEVAPYAKSISYGERSRPIPVYGKLGQASTN